MNWKKSKDLVIKLSHIFPKDLYVMNSKGCISGTKSWEETYGFAITILEPKWQEIMKEILGDKTHVYIEDITELKKALKNEDDEFHLLLSSIDMNTISKISNKIVYQMKTIDEFTDWERFTDLVDFSNVLFEKKSIYEIPIEGTDDSIRIGKPALPMMTAKNMDKWSYALMDTDEKDLYTMGIKFLFTHFTLYLLYRAIPLKKDSNMIG